LTRVRTRFRSARAAAIICGAVERFDGIGLQHALAMFKGLRNSA
jgi:hypothetical protein